MRLLFRSCRAMFGMALLVGNAYAQVAPPIRSGLWEMRSDREFDGQVMPKQQERLQRMDPALRARAEERLKHKNGSADRDVAGVSAVCLTNESLLDGRWHGADAGCTTNFAERSASAWRWHASCRQAETDGVVTFTGPEQYLFQTATTFDVEGVARVMKTNATFTWIAADCANPR